jgi:hypothetical protein
MILGPMTRYTNRAGPGEQPTVELLPSVDRDSEHPMTEIDVGAERVYARVVAQVGGLFRYLRLGWINHISVRII